MILIIAGIRFLWPKDLTSNQEPRDPPIIGAIVFGALVGLLSGLTGTGSGIFLSPILLFGGWSDTRMAPASRRYSFSAIRLRGFSETSLL